MIRYGLGVRIAGSHPAGPGSIPGAGKHTFIHDTDLYFLILKTNFFLYLLHLMHFDITPTWDGFRSVNLATMDSSATPLSAMAALKI